MDSSLSFIDVDVEVLTQDEKDEQLLNAAEAGDVEEIQILLEAGANIDAVNICGLTALIWAAENGHTDVVVQLIAAGANLESADEFGYTALIAAAEEGLTAVVEKLIKAGANIEAVDQDGRTALMLAAHANHQEAGFLLLNTLSSERVDVLSREPNLIITSLIESFRRTIARAKIDAIQAYMLMFSHKQQQRIPLELMDPILAFIFPAWLSSREDLKIEEIPELKKLLGETPKAVIFSAAEELPAQAPVAVTFRHSAAADERKEEGPSKEKHKPNR